MTFIEVNSVYGHYMVTLIQWIPIKLTVQWQYDNNDNAKQADSTMTAR